MESIGAFLSERMRLRTDPQNLERLDRLARKELGNATFFTLDEARAEIETWMPLYFLPIGTESGFYLGLHLRPSDVKEGRMAIAHIDTDGAMIEVAKSLEEYAFRAVAALEGAVNEMGHLDEFDESVALANEVFGSNFYEPGRHGDFGQGDLEKLMIEVHGGTPYAYNLMAFLADEPAERLRWLQQGIELGAESLHLYASAAEAHEELGDTVKEAAAVVRSLACYHHTAYLTDLDELRDMGRRLLGDLPDVFSDEARRDLTLVSDREWMELVMSLYQTGDVEEATKLLCDMSHEFRDYDSVLEIFRKHYEKLGWDWALALCDLREGKA